ncbi:MAG: hypothetical protein MZV64_71250 [Ignavibacteriales bacterium]|nr:hypothetical protein [Ignavibacteriales bacterium]
MMEDLKKLAGRKTSRVLIHFLDNAKESGAPPCPCRRGTGYSLVRVLPHRFGTGGS